MYNFNIELNSFHYFWFIPATKESSTLVRRINDNVDMLAEQSNTNELKVVGQLVYSLQLEDFGAHTVDSNAAVLDMTKGLVHQINDEIKVSDANFSLNL